MLQKGGCLSQPESHMIAVLFGTNCIVSSLGVIFFLLFFFLFVYMFYSHRHAIKMCSNASIKYANNSPIHEARSVQSSFAEDTDAFHHSYPAQSPDCHIIQPLWSVLVSRMRNRFPPVSFVNQLEQRFSNCGPWTTSGPRVLPLWSSDWHFMK
jgi:hypothetical protein